MLLHQSEGMLQSKSSQLACTAASQCLFAPSTKIKSSLGPVTGPRELFVFVLGASTYSQYTVAYIGVTELHLQQSSPKAVSWHRNQMRKQVLLNITC